MEINEVIDRILNGERLDSSTLIQIFTEMLKGDLEEVQTSAILAGFRCFGETENELYAGASVMRSLAIKPTEGISHSTQSQSLSDNCGTGGDGSSSFNISTASAIVASALGCKIAKHGNRSVSSKCGSADLLFACGYPDKLNPEQSLQLLEETGFTFFFAPQFHPGMKHVMPVRKKLGIRTIFNLLGPLANPITPGYQVLGVSSAKYIRPMASALCRLGIKEALVVHSRDGMDEISPCAPTDGIRISGQNLNEFVIDPEDLSLDNRVEDLKGGDATVNKQILEDLLSGNPGAVHDAICLNAGALLDICGVETTLKTAFKNCSKALKNGQVKEHFEIIISSAEALV